MTQGTGKKKNINADKKVKLINWLISNKERCRANAETLVKLFCDETGIDVSISTMLTYRNAVYPDLIIKRGAAKNPKKKLNSTRLLKLIIELGQRITRLETKLEYFYTQPNTQPNTTTGIYV